MLVRLSSLEMYQFVFMLALFAAESMLLFRMQKKRRFWLRILISLLCYLITAAIYPSRSSNAWSNSLMFSCFLVLTIFLSKWCYSITWNSCLFCTVAGYSIQHVASILYNLVITIGGFEQAASLYSGTPASFSGIQALIFLECYLLVYVCLYECFVKNIEKNDDVTITSPSLFGLITLMMLVEILLNAFVITEQSSHPDRVFFVCASITNLLCTLCVLIVLFGQLLRKSLENELEVVNQLRRQEKRQYEISKETIDMINIKCHDMKHQIHQLRHSGSITTEALKEVEKSIDIYDSIVKTGCDALDIILAEKSLFCQKNNISINCIVDGKKLCFMNEADIYSLFGNLIDNAIHSVMTLQKEKRVVSLAVKSRGQLLSINSHNFFEGKLYLEKGIPKTTSNNSAVHGFGIKSMMMTVHKYGGDISFQAKDGTFNVNILFNLPEEKV